MHQNGNTNSPVIPKEYFIPFILLTSCFALWGLLNNMTDTLVPAFGKILMLETSISTYVQVAFYGAYAVLAIPAAIIIKKYSYRTGVLIGLGLYMLGALGYIPGTLTQEFDVFLVSIFVLAGGLSILETSCNPYIISMGDESTAIRRLNIAQAFNPLGSLAGLFIAKEIILSNLNEACIFKRKTMSPESLHAIVNHELIWLSLPYLALVVIAGVLWLLIFSRTMPEGSDKSHSPHVVLSIKRLCSIPRYYWGVVAQFFYVGAQITVWTFTIHYIMAVIPSMNEAEASIYYIWSLVCFCVARIICSLLMKLYNPAKMMGILAAGGIFLSLCTIYLPAPFCIYSLVGISACMSLMFPTIYGIALSGLGDEIKLGASGLIMAILGGAVITQIHAFVIEKINSRNLMEAGYNISGLKGDALFETKSTIPLETVLYANEFSLRYSFFIPAICFAVVLAYALINRGKRCSAGR